MRDMAWTTGPVRWATGLLAMTLAAAAGATPPAGGDPDATELDPITVLPQELVEPKVRINPPYPMHAKKRWEEGCVTVRFTVRPDGKTDDFAILESKPVGVFEKSVIETVYRWEYDRAEEPRTVVETFEFRNLSMGAEPRYNVERAVAVFKGMGADGRPKFTFDMRLSGYKAPTCAESES